MFMPHSRILASILILFALVPCLRAQDETPTRVTEQNRSGDLPFSGVVGTDVERVQIANGNLVVNIPVESVPGRAGMGFKFGIWYDNRFWTAATRSGAGISFQAWNFEKRFYLDVQNSRHGLWSATQHGLMETGYQKDCGPRISGPSGQVNGTGSVIYIDSSGGKHGIEAGDESGQCFNPDGSYSFVNSGPDTTGIGAFGTEQGVTLADGTILGTGGLPVSPGDPPDCTGSCPRTVATAISTEQDSNGNFQGEFPSGADTLGRNLLTQNQSTTTVQYSFQDSNGNPQSYTVGFQPLAIATNFNVIGSLGKLISEASGTRMVETSLTLPNGRSYSFSYDSYGSLTSILLPTGGEIDYTYQNFPCGDSTYRYVATRTVTVNGQQSKWTFNQAYTGGGSCVNSPASSCTPQGGVLTTDDCTSPITVTVTDPLNNQSVYTVLEGNVTSAKIYQGLATGTPLSQYAFTYTDYNYPSSSSGTPSLWLPTKIVTQLQNGTVNEKDFQFDTLSYPMTICPDPNTCASFGTSTITKNTSRGNVTDIWEYDWGTPGSGTHGPLLRRTHKDYGLNTNSNYVNLNIVDKVTQASVYDSTANTCLGVSGPCAQTQYEYDQYVAGDNPLQAPSNSAPQHDDTGHGATFIFRGNATRVMHLRNTDGALLTTTYTYDDLGNILAIKDPRGNKVTFDYTDSFANGACPPPVGTIAQAYVSSVTKPLNQHLNVVRYPCTGLVQAHKDQNDINAGRSGTTFTYDMMNRPLVTSFPDGGQTSLDYHGDALPFTITKNAAISSTANLTTSTQYDGIGRVVQTSLDSDPQGVDFVVTTYDLLGRKATVSNPYRATSDPTYGITQYGYDVLGRPNQIIHPDGSTTSTSYQDANSVSGRAVQTQDEGNGSSRVTNIAQTDALGRLVAVCEVTGATQANGNGPSPCNLDIAGTGFLTTYQYDALSNLRSVQQGSVTRSFSYDSLSHLLAATNPESGTTSYSYDPNGNVLTRTRPAPNQGNPAATMQTSYQYDPLNRLVQTSYCLTANCPTADPLTPTVVQHYDTTSELGISLLNTVGRLSAEYTQDAQGHLQSGRVFSYDPMGRTKDNSQCTPQNCPNGTVFPVVYSYDLLGDMQSSTNGAGVTFNYSYDAAARLAGMTSNLQDSNHPGTLVSGLQYNPLGSLTASSLGSALNESFKWDCRGRVLGYASAVAPATPSQSLANTTGCPNTTALNTEPSRLGVPDPAFRLASLLNPKRESQSILLSGRASRKKDHGLVKVTLAAPSPLLKPEVLSIPYQEGETALSVAQRLAQEVNRRRSSNLKVSVRPLGLGAIIDLTSSRSDPWSRLQASVQISINSNRKVPSIQATSLRPPGGRSVLLGRVQTSGMEGQ